MPSKIVVAVVRLGSKVMTAGGTVMVKASLVTVCLNTATVTGVVPRPCTLKTLLNQM